MPLASCRGDYKPERTLPGPSPGKRERTWQPCRRRSHAASAWPNSGTTVGTRTLGRCWAAPQPGGVGVGHVKGAWDEAGGWQTTGSRPCWGTWEHSASHASPPSRKPGSPPDGPEAQTPQHLQCRSKMSPNFSSIILKHHFKALSETNCCFKLERAMVASCSDNVGGRDLLQWVCSIVRENRHDSNMLGIFGDLPDSQAASEAP